MKKVAILAAPGFEEIELMAPLDILRRLNMDVVLAGVQSDKVVSTHEVTVSTDTMLDKLHADKLDALILPGGAGSWVLRDTPEVIHLVKKMHEAGKLVAAICAAPIVLAKAGLVRDRNVTAYPAQDVYRELNEAGAHIVKDENVVLDGNMLTANGPGAAMLFPSPAYSFPQPLLQDPSHEIPRCHDNPARSRIPGKITHPRHVFRHRRLGTAPGRSHSYPLPSRQFRTLL